MAGPLTSLLADFSSPTPRDSSAMALLRPVKAPLEPRMEAQPQVPPVDRQAELIKSVDAKARAEERETARKALEEAIAAERIRHEREMDEQRAAWVEQQGLQLATQIESALDRIETMLAEKTANILRPFVSDAYRRQVLAEFEGAVATLLTGRDAGLLKISGPGDLLSEVRSHLGRHADAIEFVPGEFPEVEVLSRDTLVQTQLNSWSALLAGEMEG